MWAGDCPVVHWDFESVEADEEYRPLFSSASTMFRCLTVASEQTFNIFTTLLKTHLSCWLFANKRYEDFSKRILKRPQASLAITGHAQT